MTLNVVKEQAGLAGLTVDQLRTRYAEVLGEPTAGRNKPWLIKRIVWRLQANAEGDLSERARRRAAELANDADLRRTSPKRQIVVSHRSLQTRSSAVAATDRRLPLQGTVLTREYKGQTIRVTVLADGFEYLGDRFKSLSAVAKAITGSHWNGYHFFGLADRRSA